jgi:surfeit locus 1 family protein
MGGQGVGAMSARHFRPGVASTVVVILLFPTLLSLGFWQLDRAAQKKMLQEELAAQRDAPMLELGRLESAALEENIGRATAIQGHYRQPQFLLDNRIRNRAPGYEVFTPFELETGGIILVARGWVPAGDDRARMPQVQVDGNPRRVEGRLGRAPSTGIRLANQRMIEQTSETLYRIQHVDPLALGDRLQTTLPQVVLFLGADAENGYDRDWPVLNAQTGKHEAYATQWFAMAGVLLLLYFRINFRRDTSK